MIRDLQEWDRAKSADEPNLIVFSDGDNEEHRDIGLKSPILLDKGYLTAATLGMHGTPSAILINENGEFASETALGCRQYLGIDWQEKIKVSGFRFQVSG